MYGTYASHSLSIRIDPHLPAVLAAFWYGSPRSIFSSHPHHGTLRAPWGIWGHKVGSSLMDPESPFLPQPHPNPNPYPTPRRGTPFSLSVQGLGVHEKRGESGPLHTPHAPPLPPARAPNATEGCSTFSHMVVSSPHFEMLVPPDYREDKYLWDLEVRPGICFWGLRFLTI